MNGSPSCVLLSACLGLGLAAASAHETGLPQAGDASFRVSRWTATAGLPQNTIKALVQTKDGYLWVGTLKGLARFDGMRFKTFDHGNTPEMPYDSINELVEDRQDGVWINSHGDLLFFRNHRFHRFGPETGIDQVAGPLTAATGGGVWFSPGSAQIGLVHEGKVKTWSLGPAEKGFAINQIAEVNPRRLLLLVGWSLRSFDLDTESLTPSAMPPGSTHCYAFLQAMDGSLWLFTNKGLWRGKDARWTLVPGPRGMKMSNPTQLFQTRSGQVWLIQPREDGSSALQCVVKDRIQPLNEPGLPENLNATRFLEDREGNLWVGTPTCLFRLQPKYLKIYSRADGLLNDDVLAVTCARDGTIWLGTAQGLSLIRNGKVSNLSPPTSDAPWAKVPVFLADRANGLWLGWDGRFWRRNAGGKWERPSRPPELSQPDFIKAMYEDSRNRIWISTGQGVAVRDGQTWSFMSTTNGLSHSDVRVIFEDHNHDIWFGTYGGGVNRWRSGKIDVYKTGLSVYNDRAWWLHEDPDGVVWVGSEDGLNRIKDERLFTFTTEHGLAENVINNIQEDDSGNLWLSGLRGIYRIARLELNQVADGRRTHVDCMAYGEPDGMLNGECNGGDNQPAGCKDEKGCIWFPTVNGVVMIDPAHMRRNEVPPPVIIEAVLNADNEVIFGDPTEEAASRPVGVARTSVGALPAVTTQGEWQLPADSSERLEIRYTANSLAAPEKIRFRYKLSPHDRNWREVRDRRTAVYTNLRPGRYQFEIMAANSHGIWSESKAQFAFSIAPYFWQTWIFYGLCVVTAVATAGAVLAYRLKWQRRLLKIEQQRALANERTRIARDLHDDLGTALTGLALEMDVIGRTPGDGPALARRMGETAQRTRDLAHRMREVVWTVNPRCDTVSSLADFLEQQASQFLQSAGIHVRLEFPDDIPATPLRADARHQLALSVREALVNIVRHAQATEVNLTLQVADSALTVIIKDNGKGFDPSLGTGNGLHNMRERLLQVGGAFQCVSTPNSGTIVTFRLPLLQSPTNN